MTYIRSLVTINCGKAECLVPVTHCERLQSESQVLTLQLVVDFFDKIKNKKKKKVKF